VAKAWVALGNCLRKFIDFAVKIYQQCNFPTATITFPVRKDFENQQKHQRHGSAWVGQADFGKIELNNRNQSGNCQRLSMEEKNRTFTTQSNKRASPSVRGQYLFKCS